MNIRELMSEIINNGGFTVNNRLDKPDNLKYIVSYNGGIKFDIKELSNIKLIDGFLSLNINEKSLFGAWLDDNYVYLDKSVNFTNKQKALKFAKEQEQLAIYDAIKQESIYL